MKIGQKIIVGVFAITLLFILAGGTHIANLVKTKSQIDQIIVSSIKELESAESVFKAIQETHSTLMRLLMHSQNEEDADLISQIRDSIKSKQNMVKISISTLEKTTLEQIAFGDLEGEKDELPEIQLLRGHANTFFDLASKLVTLLEAGEHQKANALYKKSILPVSLSVQAIVSDLEIDAEEEVHAALNEARVDSQESIWISIILTVLASLAAIGLGWFISRGVTANVNKLHAVTGQLGKGKLDSRVDINSEDEVGQIAEDINRMAEGLRAAIVSRDDLAKEISERQQAEEALKKSEAKFRTIFESSNDTFILLDRDRFLDCNAATLSMFGCASRDDFLGLHPSELSSSTQPDGKNSKESADEKIETAFREGSNLFGWQHKRCSGEEFPAEVMLTRLNLDGKDVLMASVRDISERKLAAIKLKESEEVFRSTNAAVHDAIILLDNNGNISLWNRGAENIFGYSFHEVRGEPLHDFLVPQQYRKHFIKAFPEFRKTGAGAAVGKTLELSAIHKDGREFPVELSLSSLKLHGNWHAVGVVHDISDRTTTVKALRQSEEHIRLLLDSMAEAIYGLDLDGNCTFANTTCLKMLGHDDSSDLIGKNMHGLMHYALPDGSPHPEQDCRACLAFRTGEAFHVDDEVFWRKEGSSFPVSYWAHPIYKDNQITGSVVTFLDITEQLKARDELKESRRHLRASLKGTIDTVSKAVEARDPYTAGHQKRVAEIAVAIAHKIGLDKDRIEGLRMGASIHDIGKINIPAELLSKPGRLSEIEYSLIQAHAQVGYDILKDFSFPWPVANIAYQHHERLDGSGYPQGLKGDQICLEARIVAVADVVEAMASHRPYRPGLGIDKAMDEIKMNHGKLYDPAVADACLTLFADNKFSFIEIQ